MTLIASLDCLCRKLELQAEARAALEADNSWWKDAADAPANLVSAASKAEYKATILNAAPNQLVVVDYLKASCGACRRLYPKLQQIAVQNPDALFVKVRLRCCPAAVLAAAFECCCQPGCIGVHPVAPPALVPCFAYNNRRRRPSPPPPHALNSPHLQRIPALQVNVDLSQEMRELGQGLGVSHLPWFHIWRGGQLVASFSANVTTVATLRAEIAAHKACEHPACTDH
jgi:thiol-disulfide isomerase/thioredoxin